MKIRCKFVCQSVKKMINWQKKVVYEAEFSAVVDDSPENKAFWEATPNGTIKIGTYKEDHFQPGREYFVDFELVHAERAC